MVQPMSEVERWRSERVKELNSKLLDVANRRGDILYPYRHAGPGHALPEDVRVALAELDRERQAIEQKIRETDLEAARREREPVKPDPVLRKLMEELANEKHRRKWFAHAVYFRRMEGYWVCPVSTDCLPLSHGASSQSNLLVLSGAHVVQR